MFKIFWDEKFFLPENVTWKDLEPGIRDGVIYRNYNDLLWSIPLAILLIVIRLCFIKHFCIPLSHILKIKSKKVKMPFENAVLEKMYRKCQTLPTKMELVSLMKQTDISIREIERWWRMRRMHDRPTSIDKFGENCWRFLFHSFNFTFGLSILWNSSYIWNFIDLFRDYPRHSLDNGFWWYYNITQAFYISQTLLHFFETRRKDFWQMFIHHILSITLIMTSWIFNYILCFLVVNFFHDIADVFLEGAKTFKYANYKTLSTVFFILFPISWIITRLVIFSKYIYCGIFETSALFKHFPFFYIIILMHLLLFALHILWTFVIIRATSNFLTHKKIGDYRSSSENDSEDN
ncbi:unnamed protein product [Chironomus riparius]|uniref:TLC domain-containing protein n=1 Tax=Chironomus riparius TaxID=315576 RepID=A0A9N9WRD5_9DIPT|nr:unnamed protein product [Chironomus riparius]